MARDLAAELEAELEAEFGEPAELVDFAGREYERVVYRLAGDGLERSCGWGLDDDGEVEIEPEEGVTMMRQRPVVREAARFAALGGERREIRGSHVAVFNRLAAHLEGLRRRDPDLALMLMDYITKGSMAVERQPDGPPAALGARAYGDDDFVPCPPCPWGVGPAVVVPAALRPGAGLRAAAPDGGGDYAPCPPSPWG